MTNRNAVDALTVLHDLHVEGRAPTLMQLVRRTGIAAADVVRAVDQLAAQGLVDPARLRLTLFGFAAAHALAKTPAASRAA
jgi:DNA-binding IclR family transcriptional regulator